MAAMSTRFILLTENSVSKLKLLRKIKAKRKYRKKTHKIYRNRVVYGEFHHLYLELRADESVFRQYTRMTINTFDYIVEKIRVACYHCTTNFQRPISVEERLLLTLRYLSTGIAFRQIAFTFRISKSSVASIVVEVCKAIWDSLQKTHMPLPTVSDFENVAVQYYNKWNFPNCLGSVDGKHIRLKCPAKSGSMFYNYKNYFSIVLMAIVDANYRFLMIDVGAYGKDSDAGVLSNSAIYQNIENGTLVLPKDKELPNSKQKTPLVFIGDEAFPLRTYLLRPYPRRRLHNNEAASYYNYRLSRARMSVECAFGISSAKFRILLKCIETKVENAVHIVKTICILHNAIIDMEGDPFVNGLQGTTDNNHSDNNHNLRISRSYNRPTREAENLRDTFCKYFWLNKI